MELIKELMSPVLFWFIIGLVMFILELAGPGLVIFFFGVGAWIVALICYFVDISISTQLLLFCVSSICAVLLLRKWLKSVLTGHVKAIQDPSEDLEEFVGQKAIVKNEISPQKSGKVEFHGTLWTAESSDTIAVETAVRILQKENLTLKVEKI